MQDNKIKWRKTTLSLSDNAELHIGIIAESGTIINICNDDISILIADRKDEYSCTTLADILDILHDKVVTQAEMIEIMQYYFERMYANES